LVDEPILALVLVGFDRLYILQMLYRESWTYNAIGTFY